MLPTTPTGQLGPVAGWISTSGWAAAAARELGHAWVVTREGIRTPDEVRAEIARLGRGLAEELAGRDVIDRDATWTAKRAALQALFAVPRTPGRQAAFDAYRAREGELRLLHLPDTTYLMVDGHGDPNTSPAFTDAITSLGEDGVVWLLSQNLSAA